MLKNHLQKISYPLAILGTFLCVPYISAEEVDPVPNPHPAHELCNLWTLAEWQNLPYDELEKKILSHADHPPTSEGEIKLIRFNGKIKSISDACWVFAAKKKIRKAELELEKIRKGILD